MVALLRVGLGWGGRWAPLSWWWCGGLVKFVEQENRILLPTSQVSQPVAHSFGRSVTVGHPCRPGEGWRTIALVCSSPGLRVFGPAGEPTLPALHNLVVSAAAPTPAQAAM